MPGPIETAYVELRSEPAKLEGDITSSVTKAVANASAASGESLDKLAATVAEHNEAMGESFAGTASKISDTLGAATSKASSDIGAALDASSAKAPRLGQAIADAGGVGATGLGRAGKAAEDVADDAERSGGRISGAMNSAANLMAGVFERGSSAAGGALSHLATMGASVGLPMTEALDRVGGKLADTTVKSDTLGTTLSNIGGVTSVAAAAGLVGVGSEAVNLAHNFDDATTNMATNANITQGQARAIGQAFLATGGEVSFSAQQMLGAYTPVAAQLGQVQGKALDNKQALDFMRASMDLAEGSGADLNSTTRALAQTMATFQLPTDQADQAANTLYNTSRLTATSIPQVTQVVDQLRMRLGAASPPLSQIGALMDDLATHGISGARGTRMVTTGLQALVAPTQAQQTALAGLGISLTDANGKFIGLGPAIDQIRQKLGELPKTNNAGAAAAQLAADKAKLAALALQDQASASGRASGAAAQSAQALQLQNNQLQIQALQAQAAGKATDSATGPIKAQIAALQAQEAQWKATAGAVKGAVDPYKAQVTVLQAQEKAQEAASAATAGAANPIKAQIAALQQQDAQLKLQEATQKAASDATGKAADPIKAQEAAIKAQMLALQGQAGSLTQTTALQKIFGGNASALTPVIEGGSAAFERATAAVNRQKAAQEAAEERSKTFHNTMERLASTAEDLGVRFGNVLLPKITDLAGAVANIINWFTKHKDIAIALGVVIGGFLTVAVTAFAINTMGKLAKSVSDAIDNLGKLGKDLKDLPGDAIDKAKGAVDGLGSAFGKAKDAASGLGSKAADLGGKALDGVKAGAGAARDAVAALAEKMGLASAGTDVLAASEDAEAASSEVAAAGTGIFAGALDVLSANPIMLIIAAVALLVVGIYELVKHWKAVWGAIQDAVSFAVDFIKKHWQLIVDIIFGPIAIVVTQVIDHWHQIENAFSDVIDFIKDHWQLIVEIIAGPIGWVVALVRAYWGDISSGFGDVIDFIRQHWQLIVEIISGPVGWVVALVRGYWGQISSAFTDMVNFIKNTWQNIVAIITVPINAVIAIVTTLWNQLIAIFENVFNAIMAFFVNWWNNVRALYIAAWNAISSALMAAFNAFEAAVIAVWNALSSAVSAIWNGLSDALRATWDAVRDFFVGEFDAFKSVVSGAWNGIVGGITGAWNGLVGAAQNVWTNVKQAFQTGISDIENIINTVFIGPANAVLGLFGVKIPTIQTTSGGSAPAGGMTAAPGAATGAALAPGRVGAGGVTAGPTVIVGEGRRQWPEFVIPSDPTYRSNALSLIGGLVDKLGLGDSVPQMKSGGGLGGLVSDVVGVVTDPIGTVKKAAAAAAKPVLDGIRDGLDATVGKIPPPLAGQAGKGFVDTTVNDIEHWLAGQAAGGVLAMAGGGALGALRNGRDIANPVGTFSDAAHMPINVNVLGVDDPQAAYVGGRQAGRGVRDVVATRMAKRRRPR